MAIICSARDALVAGMQDDLYSPKDAKRVHGIRRSEYQMVMNNGDNVTPTFKLLRGVQAYLLPHQRLFVKTIAVLLRHQRNP